MTAARPNALLDSLDIDGALARLEPCAPCVDVAIVRRPLAEPFRIAGHIFEVVETVLLRLETERHVGHAEAAGVVYRGDIAPNIQTALVDAAPAIEKGVSHAKIGRGTD